MVSWTPQEALQTGHSKCSPGTCTSRNSKRFGSPSKRHSATRHCRLKPSAAVKSSSGVILLIESTAPLKIQIHLFDFLDQSTNSFCDGETVARNELRGYQTQNAVTFPARSEACSSEKRNKWRVTTKWGGRPFMPDSTLNRRSVALS